MIAQLYMHTMLMYGIGICAVILASYTRLPLGQGCQTQVPGARSGPWGA